MIRHHLRQPAANAGTDTASLRLDSALRALNASRQAPPPLPASLEAEIQQLQPAAPRRPRRQFIGISLLSLIFGVLLLLYLGLRSDLAGLPALWMIAYCAAWLASFLGISWLVLVPDPGRVMPDWRRAGMGAAVATIGFVAAGLLLARQAPGLSVVLEPSLHGLVRGHHCLLTGVLTALVPVVLGALILRGTLPVGSRWAGAGMGASGGSLGGLMLHLYCPVADGLHLGVVHGGVVLVSALLGMLIIPQTART